jgi:hypothetical protein
MEDTNTQQALTKEEQKTFPTLKGQWGEHHQGRGGVEPNPPANI